MQLSYPSPLKHYRTSGRPTAVLMLFKLLNVHVHRSPGSDCMLYPRYVLARPNAHYLSSSDSENAHRRSHWQVPNDRSPAGPPGRATVLRQVPRHQPTTGRPGRMHPASRSCTGTMYRAIPL